MYRVGLWVSRWVGSKLLAPRRAAAHSPGMWLVAGACAALLAGQVRAADLQVVMPPVMQLPVASETPMQIDLQPRSAVPGRAIILIKGLPSSVSLNQGRLFDSGVWGVPVGNVDDLRMITGATTMGRTPFSVSLVSFTGDLLAEAKSNLMVVRSAQPLEATAAVQQADKVRPPVADDANPSPAPARLAPAAPTAKAMEYIMLCMQKGDDAMRAGNLTLARLFYTQAAEAGWADGAFALAATYDPAELSNMRVLGGVQPDPAAAKRWYETAAQLGSKMAENRLVRLDAARTSR